MDLRVILSVILVLPSDAQAVYGHALLPVYDIRTGELFAFPETYLHMVLKKQWQETRKMKDLMHVLEDVDKEG